MGWRRTDKYFQREYDPAPEYFIKAKKILTDPEYEKKVNEVMAIIAGKKLVNNGIGSIIDKG